MDDIDRKIIAMIQLDGRASCAELAAAAGLSGSAANDRLRKLAGQGVIQGWMARIDPAALGLGVLAFVHLLLDRPERSAGFVAAVTALAEVQECHHLTGEWSWLLKIRVATIADLETLLSERIKTLPGVVRTLTEIALSSVKETPALPVVRR